MVYNFILVFEGVVLVFSHIKMLYIASPPEVNIEVPSDSDSSRRPSKCSFSGGYVDNRRARSRISSSSSMNDCDIYAKGEQGNDLCSDERSGNQGNFDDQIISGSEQPHTSNLQQSGGPNWDTKTQNTISGSGGK